MSGIGGFFDLEVPRRSAEPHPGALALSTGRACLTVMLRQLRPRRVHVPFHTCDATLQPFADLGVPTRFYGLDDDLAPQRLPDLGAGEYLLWTDYYGVCSTTTRSLCDTYGEQLLLDDTHAFFAGRRPGRWSFTSARKYFGVPDGAYLYSPADGVLDPGPDLLRRTDVDLRHLVLRRLGRQAEAYTAFLEHEASLDGTALRISELSQAIMTGVDLPAAAARRRANFAQLHALLGAANTLALSPDEDAVPFCYPFLPAQPVDRVALADDGVFVPTLWADELRRDVPGFAVDRRLARDLLPLPVDHRYGADDMDRLAERVLDR